MIPAHTKKVMMDKILAWSLCEICLVYCIENQNIVYIDYEEFTPCPRQHHLQYRCLEYWGYIEQPIIYQWPMLNAIFHSTPSQMLMGWYAVWRSTSVLSLRVQRALDNGTSLWFDYGHNNWHKVYDSVMRMELTLVLLALLTCQCAG